MKIIIVNVGAGFEPENFFIYNINRSNIYIYTKWPGSPLNTSLDMRNFGGAAQELL